MTKCGEMLSGRMMEGSCAEKPSYSRFWRIGIKVDLLDNEQVVTRIRAKGKRVRSGHLERVVHVEQALSIAVAAKPCRPRRSGGDVEEGENGGELHAGDVKLWVEEGGLLSLEWW
jgi:hypothetical protein